MKGPGGHGEVEVAVSGVVGRFYFILFSLFSLYDPVDFILVAFDYEPFFLLISCHMMQKVVSNID